MNIHELDKFTEYICRFEPEIDPNAFYVLMIVYRKDVKSFTKYFNNKKKVPLKENQFEELITLGYIYNAFPDRNYHGKEIEYFNVTDKFLKLVSIDADDAFDELRNSYPSFVELKMQDGSKDLKDAKSMNVLTGATIYNDIIKNDRLLHFKIIEIVEAYKLKFIYAPKGLERFIKEKGWEFMEEQLKSNKNNKDTIRTI